MTSARSRMSGLATISRTRCSRAQSSCGKVTTLLTAGTYLSMGPSRATASHGVRRLESGSTVSGGRALPAPTAPLIDHERAVAVGVPDGRATECTEGGPGHDPSRRVARPDERREHLRTARSETQHRILDEVRERVVTPRERVHQHRG